MAAVEHVQLAYNNVYLVGDGTEVVAIDTGPDYRGAREIILAALAGRRLSLVVATHGHLDHAGLGGWWQERGVPVLLGKADLPQARGHSDADIDLVEEYLRSVGAPADIEADAIDALETRRRWTHEMRSSKKWRPGDGRWPTALRYPSFEPRRLAEHDEVLPFGLRVLVSSGHTPGNLVVVDEADGRLFSGDQLLPGITPTPAIQFSEGQRFHSLPEFVRSLEALRSMHLSRCFPGHGAPFEDVDAVVSANLDQVEARAQRLHEVLREAGPSSVYHVAESLYPRALKRRFWQIIATVQGHLDVLERQGRAVPAEGRWRPL